MMPFQHTRFGILRHSITEWNRCRRIQGQWDSPLTEDGKTLAMTWGHALKPVSWNRILCSDLPRARKTAELINRTLDIPVMPDSRLRELDWGQWTGKTLEQLKMAIIRFVVLVDGIILGITAFCTASIYFRLHRRVIHPIHQLNDAVTGFKLEQIGTGLDRGA